MPLVLVDSSVWVDYFHDRDRWYVDRVDALLDEDRVVTGDYVVHEVLRGFDSESKREVVRNLLARLDCRELLGATRAVRSATRYRELRRGGITVRKPNDAIIASYCVDEGIALLTADRDFRPYAEAFGLRLVTEASAPT